MRLWLRHRTARDLAADRDIQVCSQTEWQDAIGDPAVISSVLWPEPPLFAIDGPDYRRRSHPHEKNYRNDPAINRSYRDACHRLAGRIRQEAGGSRCLVYAPLRGAYPVWRAIRKALPDLDADVHYPVTSSFVLYPAHLGIRNLKGRPASGRFTNRLELERLRPFLCGFDFLIYVDEVISGGMMKGHLRDMLDLGIDREIRVVAAGLADRHGERSERSRRIVDGMVESGRVHRFLWEGCQEVITEDHRFLLGVHYTDYRLGPHSVPMLTDGLSFYPERSQFDSDVFA